MKKENANKLLIIVQEAGNYLKNKLLKKANHIKTPIPIKTLLYIRSEYAERVVFFSIFCNCFHNYLIFSIKFYNRAWKF